MENRDARPRRLGRPPKGTRGDTRQELLDAALKRFAEQGYAATSVRQIAEDVGIRDSAIYAHFSAKQDLLDTLIKEYGPDLADHLGLDLSSLAEHPPQEVLPLFFKRLVAKWNEPRARLFMSVAIREGLQNVHTVLEGVRGRFVPHFEHWIESKQIKPIAPPDFLVWELTHPIASIRILYLNAQSTPPLRQEGVRLAREHVKFFLSAVSRA